MPATPEQEHQDRIGEALTSLYQASQALKPITYRHGNVQRAKTQVERAIICLQRRYLLLGKQNMKHTLKTETRRSECSKGDETDE